MTNDNDFELLTAFLHSIEPEVMGHAASAPVSDEQKELISKFAKGELGDADSREALISTLAENERALQLLVDAAKNEG